MEHPLDQGVMRLTHPEVVFGIVEEEPHLSVTVGQEHFLQGYHVGVLQLSQQLEMLIHQR